jgi:hypothetical protein
MHPRRISRFVDDLRVDGKPPPPGAAAEAGGTGKAARRRQVVTEGADPSP